MSRQLSGLNIATRRETVGSTAASHMYCVGMDPASMFYKEGI